MSKNQTSKYWKQYRRENAEKKREIERKSRQRPEYKERRKEYMRLWRIRDKQLNPHKWKARQKVIDAIESGKLVRLPCQECGDLKSEAHHENHHKPLEVMWLCRVHHSQRDIMKK